MNTFIQKDPSIERKKRLAQAMSARGQNYGPVSHWTQGLDKMSSQWLGAYMDKKADQENTARNEKISGIYNNAMNAPEGPGIDRRQHLIDTLAANPETSSAAMNLKLNQISQRDPMEDYRKKKQIDQEFAGPRKTKTIDLGGKIGVTDENNNIINTIDKSPTISEELKKAESEEKLVKAKAVKERGIQLVGELLSPEFREGTKSQFGLADSMTNWATVMPESRNAKAKLEQLEDILTAENLGMMSGVLSETDMAIIRNIAGGGLNRIQTDDEAIQQLEEIYQKLAGSPYDQSIAGSGVVDRSGWSITPNE